MDTDTNQLTTVTPEQPLWHPPSYHVSSDWSPLSSSPTALEHDPDFPNNFARSAKWCADGSSLMVQCENRSFQVFTTCEANTTDASSPRSLVHNRTFPQSASIVDFAWYPGASRHRLPAFCFVASVRDCPVKLLDGRDSRLRASYPIIDHRERFIAPHSLAFNLASDTLYCGFEDAIEIFDVQRPGEGDRMPTTPSKKSKDGLKGIISALAFSYSPNYYAAGSLTPATNVSDNIALFDESAFEPVLSMGGVARWERGGVTQLMFNPTQPHILYAAFRRSERLWSWDLRGDPSVPMSYLSKEDASSRPIDKNLTNQKMLFDVDSAGRWLALGNQRGEIAMYDLETEGLSSEGGVGEETQQVRPALVYDAHKDTVGGVVFHPLEPLLLSVSGSRHFDDITLDTPEDSDSDSEMSDESNETGGIAKRMKQRPQPTVRDASIKIWNFKVPQES